MRHTVRLHGVVIGYSELEDVDPTLGRARGRFRPGTGYELVQPVFKLFPENGTDLRGSSKLRWKKSKRASSRDALGLALEDDTGRPIRTSAIHISDYSARKGGSIDVEVLISDSGYWKRRAKV